MKSIRHVLIVQPYGIGDALFMTPLLRSLRTVPTVERVDLLLGSRTEAVFRGNPHVDRIFSIDKGQWRQSKKGEILNELHSLWRSLGGRYDLLIDFSLQREYGFYGTLLQIPRRIGLNFKNRGTFLTHSIPLNGGYEGRHAVDFYCAVGKLIGLEIEDRFLEFYVTEDDRKEAAAVIAGKTLGRFIALAPGGGESWGKDAPFKRWPAANFAELLNPLKERMDFDSVVLLGSPGEKELGEKIPGAINLCGELSLGATAALLDKSMLFLANDGGLVHLAHALHVPLIAFYGPVDPAVYGPYPRSRDAVPILRKNLPCRPCYSGFQYNSSCVDRECLTTLEPQAVMEELDKNNFWSTARAQA